jgi:hypothetical protein
MVKNVFSRISAAFLIFILFAAPVFAAQEEDPCEKEGITVRNATMLDLWFTRNGGECSIWIHEHLFIIKPGDRIDIYSDMNCKTLYCADSPTYERYKSADANGNCRINILPGCNVSDM